MLKILIVDDEINIRNLFKIRLENEGYEVYTAKDGLEALDAVYDNIIDMCIVDVMMPNLDGNSFDDSSFIVATKAIYNYFIHILFCDY